jgi:hypothetical protein
MHMKTKNYLEKGELSRALMVFIGEGMPPFG